MKRETAEHIHRAAELLLVSRNDLDAGFPADSVSRSYYAMFHAATGLLLELGIERKSHKALLSAFSEFVVKKGLLDTRYHNYFHKAFEARHDCDYLSIPKETREGATVMLQRSTEFVAACRTLLENG